MGSGWPDIFATVYKAKITRGTPTLDDPKEIKSILWRSSHDLPLPLVTDAKAAIEDLLENKRGVVRTCERTRVMPAFENV
jgi:8-oxo-dGTP diphosphatase